MILLKDYPGCREFSGIRKVSVASEKNKTYRLTNNSLKHIEKWKVDKCVFQNKTTCDFLFLVGINKNFENVYWIELKGSDIEKAAFQILRTISKIFFEKEIIHHARIIPSKNPNPKYRGSCYRKLENFVRENGGTIINQNRLLVETI